MIHNASFFNCPNYIYSCTSNYDAINLRHYFNDDNNNIRFSRFQWRYYVPQFVYKTRYSYSTFWTTYYFDLLKYSRIITEDYQKYEECGSMYMIQPLIFFWFVK